MTTAKMKVLVIYVEFSNSVEQKKEVTEGTESVLYLCKTETPRNTNMVLFRESRRRGGRG